MKKMQICKIYEAKKQKTTAASLNLTGHKQSSGIQPPPPPPVIFIAGRPMADILLWFFGDFRCGALFICGYSRYI